MYFMAIADAAAEVKMKPSLGSMFQVLHSWSHIFIRHITMIVIFITGHGAGRLHCEGPQHVCRIRGCPEGHLQALFCVSHNDDGEEEQA